MQNTTRREKLDKERVCIVCNTIYTDRKSIGRLTCYEHPFGIRDGKWICCGLEVGRCVTTAQFYSVPLNHTAYGCIRADHRDVNDTHSSKSACIKLTDEMVELMDVHIHALERDETGSTIVYRYDRFALEEKIQATFATFKKSSTKTKLNK